MSDKAQLKQKLQTEIEKQVQFLVSQRIKNHIQDFTVLYVRRNKMNVDGESMAKILDVVGVAVDDAYLKFIDEFTGKISKSLTDFEETNSDPL